MDTLTRARLGNAVWRETGLSRAESERFVGAAIEEMTAALAAGETVAIVNFGSFVTRAKGPRMGRNPKTGEPAPIAARRVVVFQPSRALKVDLLPRGVIAFPGNGIVENLIDKARTLGIPVLKIAA